MRKQVLTTFSAALGLLMLAGCQVWQPGGTRVSVKNSTLSLTPPPGWKYATSVGPDLLASKEGLVLQQIAVEHIDLAKPAKDTKRALAPGMSPFEAAEAMIGELRANQELLGFDLKENVPAEVGGKPGFRLVFSFRTKDKLHLTESRYCVFSGNVLWLVRYVAPARHYYDRDVAAFDTAARSCQFGPG